MKRIIILAILFVFSGTAFANEQIAKRHISGLRVYPNYVVVRLASSANNADECTRSNAGDWVVVQLNSEGGREFYSTILSAYVSGKEIGYGVSGCGNWGESTIPLVYRVDF